MEDNKRKLKIQSYLANVLINNQSYDNSNVTINESYIRIDNKTCEIEKIISYKELVIFAHNIESNMILIQYNCADGIQGDPGSSPCLTLKIFPEDKSKLIALFNKINKYNKLTLNSEFEGKIKFKSR